MLKLKSTLAALLAFAVTTAAVAEIDESKRIVYKRGEIFQNVAAEHVRPLLANTAWVSTWWDGQYMDKGGYAAIVWYGADGREHACITNSSTGKTGGWGAARAYSGYEKDFKAFKVRYPLKRAIDAHGDAWYQLLRYNGQTGELTTYLAGKRRWWENDVGHLQARLPAVTWEICPDFPSAESLGAKVNTKQTSRFYKELLSQDPGQRILRPQYVNECAHEWYGRKARRNSPACGGN
ncbi:hypothetical protein [uncultured Ruegeria sp.]|uniref:hypothetical protein n=1 Tax=uncultured Ruegeria sp. TaxID=259304 RepID=UPI00262B0A9E|nr:hypothetical protein [uncultured Ruegeria sp.]